MQKSNSNGKAAPRPHDRSDNTSNSEFLYSEIINQMDEAVHVVDSDLNLVLFNDSVREWSDHFNLIEPRLGTSLRKFCPFLSETVFGEYREVFATGEPHVTPESRIIIDGREYISETHKIPIMEDDRTAYVITIIRNIADSVRTVNMATSLYKIVRTPYISSNIGEFYRELYEIIQILFPAAIFSIVLYDKVAGTLSDPLTGEMYGDAASRDPVIEELEQLVIRSGEAVLIYSNSALERLRQNGEMKSAGSLISSWIGTPLRVNAETVGVLSLKPGQFELQFTEKHREILEFVSDQVAMLIERNEMLASLRESEEKYRNLVESASDGIVIIQDSRIVFANRELIRVLGFETDEVTGLEFGAIFFSQEDAVKFIADLNATDAEKVAFSEIRLKKRDGSVLYVELNRSATTYLGNRAELVFIRDITERQIAVEEKNRLQIRIQHAQKLESIGMLAGGIAHDFNNILMGILGNASLSLDQLSSKSIIRKNIERIETSAFRAADLTNQLLAYSGKGIFVIEPIQLSELIEAMLNLLETSISKSAVLDFNPCRNLLPVLGDASQIRQMVMNLVINASEALEADRGVICISTCMVTVNKEYLTESIFNEDIAEGIYVCLTISDTGCGISESDFPLIFDPFFTTKSIGRGLGLAAVLGIIRGHKGAINVRSECGKGTRFEVLLPCTEVHTGISNPRLPGRKRKRQPERGLILFVDDEEEVRNVCVRILESNGFDVISATDGVEAVEMFRENSGEVLAVFMDMLMPNMNGLEAFGKIREIRPDIRVIMCSGYTEQAVMNDFKDDSPSGFIQKPFRSKDMIQKLTDVLGSDK
ncbi:hypothetical protein DRQ25_06470 [Candidatus Fermentibacteria bacterium]|nr:MAG: hypothetical protein DRQ25_06470 [Candidatus Fermentibacteria bacterium]